jgi:tight adherence protein C
MFELVPLLVVILAFGCVAILVFVMGRYMADQASMQRRLPVPVSTSQSGGASEGATSNIFLGSLAERFDEKTFGIEGPIRAKLRRDLTRAGYFSDQAINFYIMIRLGVVLAIPLIIFILTQIFFPGLSFFARLAIVILSAFLAVLGPDAYISRRQRILQREYRLVFPDLLDMLVVCADAGLALDAAFARIQPEVSKQSHALGVNLSLLGAETRAGRSTTDALGAFAERMNIDEARAFTILLRQSLELGTDISEALRVFSDEMRKKRLLRAEENANKLPVKMVLPLGGLIFPVILMTVLVPVIIRLLAAARSIH